MEEQDLVMRDYIMGIDHLRPRNGGNQFNERAHRGVRLYGIAHISRDARPLRVSKKRERRARTTRKQANEKDEKKSMKVL